MYVLSVIFHSAGSGEMLSAASGECGVIVLEHGKWACSEQTQEQ